MRPHFCNFCGDFFSFVPAYRRNTAVFVHVKHWFINSIENFISVRKSWFLCRGKFPFLRLCVFSYISRHGCKRVEPVKALRVPRCCSCRDCRVVQQSARGQCGGQSDGQPVERSIQRNWSVTPYACVQYI